MAEQNKPGSLIDGAEDREFPTRLIEANKSFKDALANCNIRDEQQRNAIIVYHAQLVMFELTEEIEELTNILNASLSIGGYGRVLAASSHIGMLHPSTLGVKLSKEGEQAWAMAAMGNKRNRDNHSKEDDD